MDFRYLWVPMPWAQGVVSSNLAAPTKAFIFSILFGRKKPISMHRAPASGAVDRPTCIDNVGVADG